MSERTEIASLGEFGLIEHLTRENETRNVSTVLSIGDDAAVIDTFGKQMVVTTDMLVEGVHFDLMYTPLKHLGYKAVIVNLSDIYAMNAEPTQITLSIAVSNRFSVEALDEFYEGVNLACERYGVDLVGGDTTSSQKGFVISVTAIGEVEENKFVTRSGAKENDLICVTGDLGASYLGLLLMEREKQIYVENPTIQPDFEQHTYIIERLLKPEARRKMIAWFKENNLTPTSMIDISDGLSSELLHICKQSEVGCTIYEEKLPIHEQTNEGAAKFGIAATTCALNGGEDYELLFTISPDDFEKVKECELLHIIGHITKPEDGSVLITNGNNRIKLSAQGWNHLKNI
ncbi:MAG: thiamine-phosphate kinase [Chitinophagaceae bacterium]|jgi:thiamine-monophosphate kinase|nr:thiamine-phosphate kinase [Chitinophagaceae bacterium]